MFGLRSIARRCLAAVVCALPPVVVMFVAVPACGSTTVESTDAADAGADAQPAEETVTLHPMAPPLPGETECTVVMVTGIAVGPAAHVPYCTAVKYATNPPSGGDHWGTWAAFKEYSLPVPREVYVHDQEHGAVILAYRCTDPCPEVVSMLRGVMEGIDPDPLCVAAGGQPKARIVLTPDPDLPAPIAAAAWGATYTATCLDPESLSAFAAKAYGRGPEVTCFNGQDLEPPDGGSVSLCPDAGDPGDAGADG